MGQGRPSIYSQELADTICERLADGESLRSICRSDDMPGTTTVVRWLTDKETFRAQYAKARELQADALFDEMLDISDEASNDWMEKHDKENVGYSLNGEHIQRSRLRVDTRKWIAARLAPKKYGDKTTTEISGPDGGAIEVQERSTRDVAKALFMMLEQAGKGEGE